MSNSHGRADRSEEPYPTTPTPPPLPPSPPAALWLSDRCAYCRREDIPTVEVDSIHTGSGPGFPIRACRECLPATGADLTRFAAVPLAPDPDEAP